MLSPRTAACAACGLAFAPSVCEAFFSTATCSACRNLGRHPNALPGSGASLWSAHPMLAIAWHGEANRPLLPEDVGPKSQKSYIFSCSSCGASFSSSVGNLTRTPIALCRACRYAAHHATLPVAVSVADDPGLLALWDRVRNAEPPEHVSRRSNRRFYWLCEAGHSTRTTADNRAAGKRCGVCTEKYFVSSPERELRAFLAAEYGGAMELNRKKYTHPYELDVVLPDLKLAVEFNGIYFHSDALLKEKHGMSGLEYHSMKRERAHKSDLRLAFVWEDDWYNRSELIQDALRLALRSHVIPPILDRLEVHPVE